MKQLLADREEAKRRGLKKDVSELYALRKEAKEHNLSSVDDLLDAKTEGKKLGLSGVAAVLDTRKEAAKHSVTTKVLVQARGVKSKHGLDDVSEALKAIKDAKGRGVSVDTHCDDLNGAC